MSFLFIQRFDINTRHKLPSGHRAIYNLPSIYFVTFKTEAGKSSFSRNRLILFTRPLTFILEIKYRKREEDDHEVRNSRRKYFRYDVTSALFITGFPFVHVVVGAERHVVQKRFSAEISDQCMLTEQRRSISNENCRYIQYIRSKISTRTVSFDYSFEYFHSRLIP